MSCHTELIIMELEKRWRVIWSAGNQPSISIWVLVQETNWELEKFYELGWIHNHNQSESLAFICSLKL